MHEPVSPRGVGGLAARIAIVIVGVAALAWLAANLWAVDRADDASVAMARAVNTGSKPERLDRAHRMFDQARWFGPDAVLKVNEAGILGFGAPGRARPLLRAALAEEPDNVEGWVLLYATELSLKDPPEAARARRRALSLDPGVGPALRRVDASVR